MPAGAGKKGGKPAKKKGPKKSILTDENRIPLDVASVTINNLLLQQQNILLIHTIHICGLTGLRMPMVRSSSTPQDTQMFNHRHYNPLPTPAMPLQQIAMLSLL